jgi:hypothetical protein
MMQAEAVLSRGISMRTTLAIDDDILTAAKELADVQHTSVGVVISSLVRKALVPSQPASALRDGVPQFPVQPGSKPVTLEIVNRLRDELL